MDGAKGDGREADAYLEALCERYRYPVYAFVRNRVKDVDLAQDYTQSFFVELIVEKKIYQFADKEAGRFRTFLLACLKNFLNGEHRMMQAQKRGGGVEHLQFDELEMQFQGDESESDDATLSFDRTWARTVFDQVWSRIEREYGEAGQAEQFQELRKHMMGDGSGGYAESAERLGLSEGGLKKAAFRLRGKFRDALREAVASLVEHPTDVDDEISYLIRMIA